MSWRRQARVNERQSSPAFDHRLSTSVTLEMRSDQNHGVACCWSHLKAVNDGRSPMPLWLLCVTTGAYGALVMFLAIAAVFSKRAARRKAAYAVLVLLSPQNHCGGRELSSRQHRSLRGRDEIS